MVPHLGPSRRHNNKQDHVVRVGWWGSEKGEKERERERERERAVTDHLPLVTSSKFIHSEDQTIAQ